MTVLTSASHAKVTPRTARPEIKREHPLPLSSIHPHPPPPFALSPLPACLPASLCQEKREGKGEILERLAICVATALRGGAAPRSLFN